MSAMRTMYVTLLFAVIFSYKSFAQGIPVAQFFSMPLILNPAFTGLVNGDMRAAANNYHYGGNGLTKLNVTNVSVDMPMLTGVLPKGDALGIGLLYQRYSFDAEPTLHTKKYHAGLSLAYHKSLGKSNKHHLSLGVQAVHSNILSDYFPYGGSATYYAYNYQKSNIGILYSGQLSDKVAVYGGYGIYHIDFPDKHPSGIYNSPINTFTAGGSFNIGRNMSLYANAIVYTVPHDQKVQISSFFKFPLSKTNKKGLFMYAGAIYSHEYTLSPYLGFEAARLRLGVSYEFYTDPLEILPPYRSGFEVSLIYTGKFLKKQNANWHCPTLY